MPSFEEMLDRVFNDSSTRLDFGNAALSSRKANGTAGNLWIFIEFMDLIERIPLLRLGAWLCKLNYVHYSGPLARSNDRGALQ